jgi:DNA polymerase III delta subunit
LVIVRSADEFSAPEARLLGENLSSIPASTCLIFLYDGKANLREEIPAHVSSHGAIVTFWTPFPNQLPMWVRDEAKLRGKTITTDAAMALAESCDDLQGISNELDKLSLFVGKKNRDRHAGHQSAWVARRHGEFSGF